MPFAQQLPNVRTYRAIFIFNIESAIAQMREAFQSYFHRQNTASLTPLEISACQELILHWLERDFHLDMAVLQTQPVLALDFEAQVQLSEIRAWLYSQMSATLFSSRHQCLDGKCTVKLDLSGSLYLTFHFTVP